MYLEGTIAPSDSLQQRRVVEHIYCKLIFDQPQEFVYSTVWLLQDVVIMWPTRLRAEQCIFVADSSNNIHDYDGVEGEAKVLCAIIPI